MSLPSASPKKRRLSIASDEDGTPHPPPTSTRYTTPPKIWSREAEDIFLLFNVQWDNLIRLPYGDTDIETAMYHWTNIREKLKKRLETAEEKIQELIELNQPEEDVQTDMEDTRPPTPPSRAQPTPPPALLPPPSPTRQTYASVVKPHLPRQPQRKRQPRAQPMSTRPADPVRLIAHLQDQPDLEMRALPTHKLFQHFSNTIPNTSKAPNFLNIYWNKKGNLIFVFPSGSSHNSIKHLFPHIRSTVGAQSEFPLRFDIPQRKIHLAGIRVRDDLDSPLATTDELMQSLQLNPAINVLKITQLSWLRKPENITNTHTSAVLAFEDPDGTVERNLLKTTVYTFGERVTMKRWLDKPPTVRGKGKKDGEGGRVEGIFRPHMGA